eukprot:maker-scaffold_11-snap-gene-6.8-mRNA-1 protein AED:0.02 eAED:0.02 QI:16/1/0.5/1/1/1/2/147/257
MDFFFFVLESCNALFSKQMLNENDYSRLEGGEIGGILYAAVSQKQIFVVETTLEAGNFSSVARVLLSKVVLKDNEKRTFATNDFVFHLLMKEGYVFLCLADKSYSAQHAFMFLEEVVHLFTERYISIDDSPITSFGPLELNNSFGPVLRERMTNINKVAGGEDILGKIKTQVNDVKTIVVENIEKVMERGEKIEVLVDKTNEMQNTAFKFESSAKSLKNSLWWKNFRKYVGLCTIVVLFFYYLVASFCGITLSQCNK